MMMKQNQLANYIKKKKSETQYLGAEAENRRHHELNIFISLLPHHKPTTTTLPLPLLHQNLLFPHNQTINRTHPRARVANFLLCSLTLYLFLCFFFVQDTTSERKQKKRNQHVLKIQYSLPSLHNQDDQQEPTTNKAC